MDTEENNERQIGLLNLIVLGFEFSSAVNLNIADDSITLTNSAVDAQVDTKVIVNTLSREIANLPSFGFNADRNGQYIDSIADLDSTTKSPGDTLTVPAPYIVEIGAIVYNSVTYQPGDRFTTVTGQTAFTSVAGGVLREILEAPNATQLWQGLAMEARRFQLVPR
jgi:hypothetical protein